MSNNAKFIRAAASGLIGGAVGTAAMNASMKLTEKLLLLDRWPAKRELCEGESASWSQVGEHHHGDEPATLALGRFVYEALTGTTPDAQTQAQLGAAVHWVYGLSTGLLFGLIRGEDRWLITDAVGGVAYGVGLWVLGDMLVVPLLGLADKPTRYGLRMHAHTLSGHLVYGLATAAATRVASEILD